ncbi:MAG: Ntn hydrolase family protein [Anaerolineae bacterium]
MTLVIGVLCDGGVVLAADGAATFEDVSSRSTIRQPTRKLRSYDGRVATGVSGSIGVAQAIEYEIEQLCTKQTIYGSKTRPTEAATQIRKQLWTRVGPEFEVACQAARLRGHIPPPCLATVLLMAPIGGNACLIEFDKNLSPELKSRDIPFVSIGSGQPIADPFLAFIRRVFWEDGSLPTIAEGKFAAVWTLLHTIGVHPGGVSDPIQMMVLDQQSRGSKEPQWRIRDVDPAELGEHRQACEHAELHLRKFTAGFGESSGEPAEAIPVAPL